MTNMVKIFILIAVFFIFGAFSSVGNADLCIDFFRSDQKINSRPVNQNEFDFIKIGIEYFQTKLSAQKKNFIQARKQEADAQVFESLRHETSKIFEAIEKFFQINNFESLESAVEKYNGLLDSKVIYFDKLNGIIYQGQITQYNELRSPFIEFKLVKENGEVFQLKGLTKNIYIDKFPHKRDLLKTIQNNFHFFWDFSNHIFNRLENEFKNFEPLKGEKLTDNYMQNFVSVFSPKMMKKYIGGLAVVYVNGGVSEGQLVHISYKLYSTRETVTFHFRTASGNFSKEFILANGQPYFNDRTQKQWTGNFILTTKTPTHSNTNPVFLPEFTYFTPRGKGENHSFRENKKIATEYKTDLLSNGFLKLKLILVKKLKKYKRYFLHYRKDGEYRDQYGLLDATLSSIRLGISGRKFIFSTNEGIEIILTKKQILEIFEVVPGI